jgi:hypothetical protein
MAFTTCSVATNNISMLEDQPNDVGGLTAAELKAAFDKFGKDFVAWFNETHVAELDAHEAEHGLETKSGNWTPTISAETTNPSVTYTNQRGTYVKVGKLTKCSFYVAGIITGGEGFINIGGFPFAIKNLDEAGVVSRASLYNTPLNYSSLFSTSNNTNKVRVYKDTRYFAEISEVNNGKEFSIGGSITYEAV